MKKKIILIISMIIILIITTQCTTTRETENSKSDEDKTKEITIMIWKAEYNQIEQMYGVLEVYKDKFESETGNKIVFDVIHTNTYDDYIKKMNVKLYLKDGPTLIFFGELGSYKKYVDGGIALNVDNKILNLSKVYNNLKYKGGFIPIGMNHYTLKFNKEKLDDLGVKEPNVNWTRDDYENIMKKWRAKEPRVFNMHEYEKVVLLPLRNISILDSENGNIDLNNSRMIQFINDARSKLYSGDYIPNSNYTYKDYSDIFQEIYSPRYMEMVGEERQHRKRKQEDLENSFRTNGLKSILTSRIMDNKHEIRSYTLSSPEVILPNVINPEDKLKTWGFIVNKNGRNTDIGMEFLNGLLSDKTQLIMFNGTDVGAYPVNKEIEDEIERIEKQRNMNQQAVILRKYILKKIENGEYEPYGHQDDKERELRKILHKDISKFIIAEEPYTDEEISRELEKLESRYNIWLNE